MYLDDLDDLLRAGASTLSAGLRERQRGFVLQRQRADGGFTGRQGGSDLYYTDFALRILTLTGPDDDAARRAAAFVGAAVGALRGVVDCFCALNAARMLARMGLEPPAIVAPAAAGLAAQSLSGGGFARQGGGPPSAYSTFLAALGCEMLGQPFPEAAGAASAIAALRRPDGGFADLPGGPAGQTNATAAAIAFLTLSGALTATDPAAVNYLCAMQTGDGGFRASADAPESDLLSTFTALVSLFVLDGLKKVDLAAAIRWIGRLAEAEGGFRAAASDTETDLEYTFYGLGALALVRAYAGLMRGIE